METNKPSIDSNFRGTIVIDNYRITRYSHSLKIEDLANAGKRGKTCLVYTVWGDHYDQSVIYNTLDKINKFGIAETIKDPLFTREERKGIEISPDYPKIEIHKDKFYLSIEPDNGTFEIRIQDLTDPFNEPTSIFCRHNKTERSKVYKAISQNLETFKGLNTSYEVMKLLQEKTGIILHTYCAVD